ncbi:MAG: hypothetical protein AAF587_00595 [Bacteroidota bacterium]
MKNRKCWILLNALSKKELRKCERWIGAELHTRLPEVRQLFVTLKEFHGKKTPQRDAVQAQLGLDEAHLRKCEYSLAELLSEFLAIEAFRADRPARNVYLLQALVDRVDPNTQEKCFRKAQKELDLLPQRNGRYYRYTYEYQVAYNQFMLGNTLGKHIPEHLAELSLSFDRWWIHDKLALACVSRSSGQKHGSTQSGWLETDILEQLSVFPQIDQLSVLHLYRELLLLSKDTLSNEKLEQLQQEVIRCHSRVNKGELADLFGILLNHAILNMYYNKQDEAIQRCLDIYEWGVEKELLLSNGFLPVSHYLNLVITNLKLRNFVRAKRIIDKYRKWLDIGLQEDVVQYALGMYHFYRREFASAIRYLMQCQFPGPVRAAVGNIYLWQSWYEQANKEKNWKAERNWLMQRLSATRKSIQEMPHLPEMQKQTYMEILGVFKELITAKQEDELKALPQKYAHLLDDEKLSWIQEKVQERIWLGTASRNRHTGG